MITKVSQFLNLGKQPDLISTLEEFEPFNRHDKKHFIAEISSRIWENYLSKIQPYPILSYCFSSVLNVKFWIQGLDPKNIFFFFFLCPEGVPIQNIFVW